MQPEDQGWFEKLTAPPFDFRDFCGYQTQLNTIKKFISDHIKNQGCNKLLILLTGQAGAGKTSLVCKLKQMLKQNNPVHIINIVNIIARYGSSKGCQQPSKLLVQLCRDGAVVVFDQFQQIAGRQIFEIFLEYMQKSTKTMFILVTNNQKKLPKLNDFDAQITINIGLPSLSTRQKLLKNLCQKQQEYFDQNIDYKKIAQITESMTPADIVCMIRQVAMMKLKDLISKYSIQYVQNLTEQQKQMLKSTTKDFIQLIESKKLS